MNTPALPSSLPATAATAPPGAAPPVAASSPRHWRKTRVATAALLLIWFVITFGTGFFARGLGQVRLFGWPLSYYMGAQGALIVFLLIIGGYALLMRRFDREAEAGRFDQEAERRDREVGAGHVDPVRDEGQH